MVGKPLALPGHKNMNRNRFATAHRAQPGAGSV